MKKIIELLFPAFLFEMLENISLKLMYKYRKIDVKYLVFRNNNIYYSQGSCLFTGRTIFNYSNYVNNGYKNGIDEKFFNTVWSMGLNGFLDKDEFMDEMVGEMELYIFQGKIKKRKTYRYSDKSLFKEIDFENDGINTREIFYFDEKGNRLITVVLKDFKENNKTYEYKEVYKRNEKTKVYYKGELKEEY